MESLLTVLAFYGVNKSVRFSSTRVKGTLSRTFFGFFSKTAPQLRLKERIYNKLFKEEGVRK